MSHATSLPARTQRSPERQAYLDARHEAESQLAGWHELVEHAGVLVGVNLYYAEGGPGLRAGVEVDCVSDPVLVDAAEWDACYPGQDRSQAAIDRWATGQWDLLARKAIAQHERDVRRGY